MRRDRTTCHSAPRMRTASMASGRAGGFSALLLFLAVRLHVADCEKVILGDQFEVRVNCQRGESGQLLQVRLDGTRKVATFQRGQWTVSGEFRARMKTNSSEIVLAHVQLNDEGMYELTCSASGIKRVQLEVVVAFEKSVTEDDDVTLPCYVETLGKTGLTEGWERKGKPLCVKDSISEGCSGTPADRLSVSTDWITSGDLSLNIAGVQPEDRGVYFCYIQDQHGKRPGNPAVAFRLTVIKKMTHQMINSTATPRNPTQSCAEHTKPWQISTSVLCLILLLVAVLLSLWRPWKRG